jgi:hypothetical protein
MSPTGIHHKPGEIPFTRLLLQHRIIQTPINPSFPHRLTHVTILPSNFLEQTRHQNKLAISALVHNKPLLLFFVFLSLFQNSRFKD